MTRISYYIDSCIYLNIWQKEVSTSGVEFWRFAKEFFDKIEENNKTVFYSGFILKELSYILNEKEFIQKRKVFDLSKHFKKVTLTSKELEEARGIEREIKYDVSFYDIIHMILARKSHSILITRDKRLMNLARKHQIPVQLPEEAIKKLAKNY